jgi:hypothetical protein
MLEDLRDLFVELVVDHALGSSSGSASSGSASSRSPCASSSGPLSPAAPALASLRSLRWCSLATSASTSSGWSASNAARAASEPASSRVKSDRISSCEHTRLRDGVGGGLRLEPPAHRGRGDGHGCEGAQPLGEPSRVPSVGREHEVRQRHGGILGEPFPFGETVIELLVDREAEVEQRQQEIAVGGVRARYSINAAGRNARGLEYGPPPGPRHEALEEVLVAEPVGQARAPPPETRRVGPAFARPGDEELQREDLVEHLGSEREGRRRLEGSRGRQAGLGVRGRLGARPCEAFEVFVLLALLAELRLALLAELLFVLGCFDFVLAMLPRARGASSPARDPRPIVPQRARRRRPRCGRRRAG